MKSNLLLASLFAVCASGSLMSMENNSKARLNFLLNHSRCIKGYSKQNMDYAVQPNVFVGQNILDAIPLDEHDRNVLDIGFNEAVEKEITVKKFYMLKDAEFLATITPLIKANKKNNFFVKVQETSNNVELID
jgi:hypothetical protein